ncbi:uncharacterized protein [Procambarus clarkii]|uniref:uncharacterized protein n=1 Tax=Procambarus clarkii TaxID=6728 RepID=UPI003743F59D
MVEQVLGQHMLHCHLVLMEQTQKNSLLPQIVRGLSGGVVVADAQQVLSQDLAAREQLLQRLWGDSTRNCRGLLVFIDSSFNHTNIDNSANHTLINTSISMALRFLEWCGLWQYPETRVVVVGGRADVGTVLLHHSLRNTLHALYIALEDDILHEIRQGSLPNTWLKDGSSRGEGDQVSVFRRCLYCDHGEAGLQLLQQDFLTSGLLQREGLFIGFCHVLY